jgi:RNA polymerase sigma factor (sigma-70 family)
MQEDRQIIEGLRAGFRERVPYEKILYLKFNYFIREGCRKYFLSQEDSFSAYSDTVLSAILNIVNDKFDGKSSLKTYLFKVFCNKCIDIVRKNSINKQRANHATAVPEMLGQLPDKARSVIEQLIHRDTRNAVWESLEQIGEKCKEILLFFEDGYSDREIAEKLAYSSAAVAKTTRLRCIEKIRERVNYNLHGRDL